VACDNRSSPEHSAEFNCRAGSSKISLVEAAKECVVCPDRRCRHPGTNEGEKENSGGVDDGRRFAKPTPDLSQQKARVAHGCRTEARGTDGQKPGGMKTCREPTPPIWMQAADGSA